MKKYTNLEIKNESLLLDFNNINVNFTKKAGTISDLIKDTYNNLENNNFYFLFFLYSGRKIINNISGKEAAKIIDGKRLKVYWTIKNKEKVSHKFFWVKFKRLSKDEIIEIESNWNENYVFTQKAKELIVKSSGVTFYNMFLKSKQV